VRGDSKASRRTTVREQRLAARGAGHADLPRPQRLIGALAPRELAEHRRRFT
jgi:hypothetical protein